MCMPKAMARWATSLPMRPSPITPRVLSASSTPVQRLRSQRPDTSAAWAWGTLRAWASSSAMVCSAAERMFDCGAFTTITPRSVAAATSTLSSPMPARPTTTSSVPAARTSAVTRVAERMTSAWAPSTASSSSSGLRPTWTSTVCPASRRRSRPPSAMGSVTRIRAMAPILAAPRRPPPAGWRGVGHTSWAPRRAGRATSRTAQRPTTWTGSTGRRGRSPAPGCRRTPRPPGRGGSWPPGGSRAARPRRRGRRGAPPWRRARPPSSRPGSAGRSGPPGPAGR